MFRRWVCFLISLVLMTGCAGAAELSIGSLEDSPALELDCAAALLVEPDSGQIIFEKNADEQRAVASVTKIMSILLNNSCLFINC